MKKKRIHSRVVCLLVAVVFFGCHVQPPAGQVIQPRTQGAAVDHVNQMQEENSEFAKLIVYTHEFEINLQDPHEAPKPNEKTVSAFEYKPPPRVRGFRLNPSGQDHVRQIAKYLNGFPGIIQPMVVVERSQTSKQWNTKHRYPVHFNDELDVARRQIVVESLLAFGVQNADEIVIVAPAFPTGLNALEAASAYRNAIGNSGSAVGNGNFAGRF